MIRLLVSLSGAWRDTDSVSCNPSSARRLTATVRRSLGGDIDASCGQLRRKAMEKEGPSWTCWAVMSGRRLAMQEERKASTARELASRPPPGPPMPSQTTHTVNPSSARTA